ncbi:MAG: hypothetical protein Q7V05_16385 [Methanoregula sp.]|nr:hypothetical protein [Methanoregula sp.]
MPNLQSQIILPINLEIFSDEILKVTDTRDGSKWMYLGILFVQKEKKDQLLQQLNNLRCVNGHNWHPDPCVCESQCGYHDRNDTEIHYKELHHSDSRFRIAKNWISFVKDERYLKNDPPFYFNILGLNLTSMNLELFGEDSGRDLTIYNRFYRSAILGGLNYFFKGREIVIHDIFHDRGSQEHHRYFPWQVIHQIDLTNEKTTIIPSRIKFIDSDHRASRAVESHFIQFIDILLGATYVGLHNPSEEMAKKKIGFLFRPVLECLLDRRESDSGPWIGTYYQSKYHRTCQVSFFPKRRIDLDNAQLDPENFNRELRDGKFFFDREIQIIDPSITRFDQWFG